MPPTKIGMLAISGMRTPDQELPALVMMLPELVERGKVTGSLPRLGLHYLALNTKRRVH